MDTRPKISKTLSAKKRLAIVVGHTKASPGACSPHGIPCEWYFNSVVADLLKDIADVYHYDTYAYGYTTMVKKNAAIMNPKKYDAVFELHYNAASPLANGSEMLYYFASKKGKQYATIANQVIVNNFKVKDRGIKALVSSKDRGFAAVYYTSAPTVMFEPFFGSSAEDSLKFIGQEQKYADCIRVIYNKIINL